MNDTPNRPGRPIPSAHASTRESFEPTVLAWRPLSQWGDVRAEVIRSDANVAELMLGLVRETAAAAWDESRLLDVIHDFSCRAFPNASHLVLAERDDSGELRPLIARSRDSRDTRELNLSRTITERVLREGCALLYAKDQDRDGHAQSVVLSQLETAICAPVLDHGVACGVLQLDVRRPARGRFTREDVDLLSVVASQVGLVLEFQRMVQQQKRAFESTVNALVTALAIGDPERAGHSGRVRALALGLGRAMGFSGASLDALASAALLHDLGDHGLHHHATLAPDRVTPAERAEFARESAGTQAILDLIEYPLALRDVTRITAHLNSAPGPATGSDPESRDLRTLAHIVAVADACDALFTARAGERPWSPDAVAALLARGKGSTWDPGVVDAACAVLGGLHGQVYGSPAGPAAANAPEPRPESHLGEAA